METKTPTTTTRRPIPQPAPGQYRVYVLIYKITPERFHTYCGGGDRFKTLEEAEAMLSSIAASYPRHHVRITLRAPGIPVFEITAAPKGKQTPKTEDAAPVAPITSDIRDGTRRVIGQIEQHQGGQKFITLWGQRHEVPATQVYTWEGKQEWKLDVETAATYPTGQKIARAHTAVWYSPEKGFTLGMTCYRNSNHLRPIAFWADYAADPANANRLSKHDA